MAALQQALERFGGELRGFTGRLSDAISGLKRGADARPHAGGAVARDAPSPHRPATGVRQPATSRGSLRLRAHRPHAPTRRPATRRAVDAFRENLADLERAAADIAADAAALERVTTEAVSLEVSAAAPHAPPPPAHLACLQVPQHAGRPSRAAARRLAAPPDTPAQALLAPLPAGRRPRTAAPPPPRRRTGAAGPLRAAVPRQSRGRGRADRAPGAVRLRGAPWGGVRTR